MALGLVPQVLSRDVEGRNKRVILTVDWPTAYHTGGEPFDPALLFGLKNVRSVLIENKSGLLFEYDSDNRKIKAYWPTNLTPVTPIFSVSGSDIAGSANTDSENADAAALPTNGNAVSANAAVSGGAWTRGALTNPGTGRNVCIVVTNDSGGALNLYEGISTFTVTGTWKGAVQTETITITSTAGNKAVADTKFRYKYGVKPFDTVTNITVDNVPANGLKIGAGLGSKVGLYNALKTPLEADVLKITKNAAHLAVTGIVDTTNNTVNLGVLAANDDWEIVYQAAPYSTGVDGAAVEITDGTDLSALLGHRLVILGS